MGGRERNDNEKNVKRSGARNILIRRASFASVPTFILIYFFIFCSQIIFLFSRGIVLLQLCVYIYFHPTVLLLLLLLIFCKNLPLDGPQNTTAQLQRVFARMKQNYPRESFPFTSTIPPNIRACSVRFLWLKYAVSQ